MRWPSQKQRGDSAKFVSPVKDKIRVYRFPWRSSTFSILAANLGSWPTAFDEWDIWNTPPTGNHGLFQFFECLFAWRAHRRHFNDQWTSCCRQYMALGFGVRPWYRGRFKEHQQPYGLLVISIDISLGSRGHTQAAKVLVLCRKDQLPWPCYSIRTNETIGADNRSCTQTQGSYNSNTTAIVLGAMQRILLFCFEILKSGSTVEQKLWRDQPTLVSSSTEGEKDAVENLKILLTNQSILARTRGTRQFIIDTEVCYSQVWCLLLQTYNNCRARPIWYRYHMLSNAEWMLETTDKNWLAIVYAVLLRLPCWDPASPSYAPSTRT